MYSECCRNYIKNPEFPNVVFAVRVHWYRVCLEILYSSNAVLLYCRIQFPSVSKQNCTRNDHTSSSYSGTPVSSSIHPLLVLVLIPVVQVALRSAQRTDSKAGASCAFVIWRFDTVLVFIREGRNSLWSATSVIKLNTAPDHLCIPT